MPGSNSKGSKRSGSPLAPRSRPSWTAESTSEDTYPDTDAESTIYVHSSPTPPPSSSFSPSGEPLLMPHLSTDTTSSIEMILLAANFLDSSSNATPDQSEHPSGSTCKDTHPDSPSTNGGRREGTHNIIPWFYPASTQPVVKEVPVMYECNHDHGSARLVQKMQGIWVDVLMGDTSRKPPIYDTALGAAVRSRVLSATTEKNIQIQAQTFSQRPSDIQDGGRYKDYDTEILKAKWATMNYVGDNYTEVTLGKVEKKGIISFHCGECNHTVWAKWLKKGVKESNHCKYGPCKTDASRRNQIDFRERAPLHNSNDSEE